ncbi:hypothetical protein F5Y16DRAFT_101218 [Xylariaceae sp. FL0255]|nr:hypothetical protein F5Y16DRAFT_101218 [Xylariaceae sp. FL0255]
MLPPIDSNILKNNPKFSQLYESITTDILNPDASTKTDPHAHSRDAVFQELQAYRLKAARLGLLRFAISTAVTPPPPPPPPPSAIDQQQQTLQHRRTKSRPQSQSSLPPDLLQLLLLIPPFLDNATPASIPPESLQLLLSSPPFSNLAELFPALIECISTRLSAQASSLARVISPTTNPSYIHRVIPTLPQLALDLVADTSNPISTPKNGNSILSATADLTAYLHQQTQTLIHLLDALELKHGAMGTSASLRAQEATQQAQVSSLASKALLAETRLLVYPPSAQRALGNYNRHLGDAARRAEDAMRVREAELGDYGVAVSYASGDAEVEGSGHIAGHARNTSNTKKARSRAATTTDSGGGRGRGVILTVTDENRERTMREMARVWREMDTRLREVQGDLRRLE